jgi:hypothetical protein
MAPRWISSPFPGAPATGAALAGLFDGFEPGRDGSLLLWHGVPGTGKSHALGALAHAWRSCCAIQYVADPEDLLGDFDYLLSVTLHPVDSAAPRPHTEPTSRRRTAWATRQRPKPCEEGLAEPTLSTDEQRRGRLLLTCVSPPRSDSIPSPCIR